MAKNVHFLVSILSIRRFYEDHFIDQRNMGMSMKIQKSTLDDVRARLASKKQQTEDQKKEYDIEERVKELQEEVKQ